MIGPATDAIPYIPPTRPMYVGRFSSGEVWVMISNAPENIPEEPHPAIARPAIKALDVGATAQMRLPSSNIPIADKKTHLMLQNV
jgi:hypothetical protein